MPGLGPTKAMQTARRAAKRYEAGVMPYHQALAALKLPPRGPTGSEANMARVGTIARAMRRVKVSR